MLIFPEMTMLSIKYLQEFINFRKQDYICRYPYFKEQVMICYVYQPANMKADVHASLQGIRLLQEEAAHIWTTSCEQQMLLMLRSMIDCLILGAQKHRLSGKNRWKWSAGHKNEYFMLCKERPSVCQANYST